MADIRLDLGLDQERIGQLIQAAILQEIGPEQREKIIVQSLTWLTQKPDPSDNRRYGLPPEESPLQKAFNSACMATANKVVQEMIDSDPRIRAKIQEMMGEAVMRFIASDYDEVAGLLREAVTNAFLPKR